MSFYRVRPGQAIGVSGETKREGTILEIARHIGAEFRHLLEPITKRGDSLDHLSPEELAEAQEKDRAEIVAAPAGAAAVDVPPAVEEEPPVKESDDESSS